MNEIMHDQTPIEIPMPQAQRSSDLALRRRWRAFLGGAIILIPLIIAVTWYLYGRNERVESLTLSQVLGINANEQANAVTDQPVFAVNEPLKKELENIYTQARMALGANDPLAINRLIEQGAHQVQPPSEIGQTLMSPLLADRYPELPRTAFIVLSEKGDYAYYITQTQLEDQENYNVTGFTFHQVNGMWKLSTEIYGTSVVKKDSEGENRAILHEMASLVLANLQDG